MRLALALAPFVTLAQSADRPAPAVSAPLTRSDVFDVALKLVGAAPAGSHPRPERFSEFALSVVGPAPLIGEAAGAALGQWTNTPEEWGQGWDAFGKRYWSNLAYNGIRQTITYGGSLALREDTRYFAASSESGISRTDSTRALKHVYRSARGWQRFVCHFQHRGGDRRERDLQHLGPR